MNEKEQIKEINQHIGDALEQWSRIMCKADADEWAYHLDYTDEDLFNVLCMFNHVCANYGIKNGTLNSEVKAEKFGVGIRELLKEHIGVDTVKLTSKVLYDMKWFTIEELTKSETAKKYKIDNTPNQQQLSNLVKLVNVILDPLREEFGKCIWVNSGFRSKLLNEKVGGVDDSHHRCENGYAAVDITSGTKTGNRILFGLCQAMDLPFCQLIDEDRFSWLHISYNPNDVRKQVLHL